MTYKSKWAKWRGLAVVVLGLTGVGAPIATLIVTGADVAAVVADDISTDNEDSEQDNGN